MSWRELDRERHRTFYVQAATAAGAMLEAAAMFEQLAALVGPDNMLSFDPIVMQYDLDDAYTVTATIYCGPGDWPEGHDLLHSS